MIMCQSYIGGKRKVHACNPNQNEHGGSCYHFSLGASDFETSKASCASLGMHLVFIGSQDEQDFLVVTGLGYEYWIGLSTVTSLDNAATSTWLDGSSLTYINFAVSGWTFDQGGECFRMSGSQYEWMDMTCSVELHYICETENSEC
ncbi:C-type lectin domain family 4 member G-like [Strongylocentrotus purpuratus]|uniref:C-type lectin domain-containing protein n=1 Tax=Strongylocentrotus purpuratus TaxID=7668 RepID=A0A7M7PLN0_STRPU|nr:C-type lectin domain family 4 member G-like [Strongylocentrotus purpuratus]